MTWTEILAAPGARRLRPAQEGFLGAAWSVAVEAPGPWGPRGVVALLGCGHGKTLCARLAPVLLRARRPLLVHPAALAAQTERDGAEWSREYPLPPIARLHYEALSHPRGVAELDRLAPDLLVLDEAHYLGSPTSARWRRIARYLTEHPDCRVVVLSGTLSWGSVTHLAHLLHATLRDRSPIPAWAAAHMAAVIDVGGEPSADDWLATERVLGQIRPRTKDAARRRLFAALTETPGVVHAAGVAADVSLTIEILDIPEAPPDVRAALAVLAERWELPDGTQLVDALAYHRHRSSLGWGWYARWVPGTVDEGWNAVRLAWAAAARSCLAWTRPDLDTLGQLEEIARTAPGELDRHTRAAWDAWATVPTDATEGAPPRPPYREWPEPPTEVVWLDGAQEWAARRVRVAISEARSRPGPVDRGAGVLIWYTSKAFETVARAAGLPVHGAGSRAPEGGDAAVSILVHGGGWNGQRYSAQVVAEPPSSSRVWEQLLARTHRPGQTRDVWVGISGDSEPVARAFAGARYSETVLGAPQRLTLATWPQGRPTVDAAPEGPGLDAGD